MRTFAKRDCSPYVYGYLIFGTANIAHLSASGLVVKFIVAIDEPPVRFRACADFWTNLPFTSD